MPEFTSSLVIPVENQWELTRNCLKSIAATTDRAHTQVIVVDNASADATARGCPFLGEQLFGAAFGYIRNEEARPLAAARNQGAAQARGDFLIFLQPDMVVQPGWQRALLDDFSAFPDIGGAGALLVSAELTPLGRTVRDLGLVLSPTYDLKPLYAGIPAGSPLARRRRFFQALGGASLAMERARFMELGGFDEAAPPGLETVELCARLGRRGLRMTVSPEAVAWQHGPEEGRQPGGAGADERGREILSRLGPDWHLHVEADGLVPGVDEWLTCRPALPREAGAALAASSRQAGLAALKEALTAAPFWLEGWERAVALAENPAEKAALLDLALGLFPTPPLATEACALAAQAGDRELARAGEAILKAFAVAPASLLRKARRAAAWCRRLGLGDMAARYAAWAENYGSFSATEYPRFARAYLFLAEQGKLPAAPQDYGAYAVWSSMQERAERERARPPAAAPGFSLLMPVYDPRPEHLRAALDSVLAQTWGDWELCIADDASPGEETGAIIREYLARDSRIRAVFRERNGRIAQASNSALALATRPWALLMDQDDLLAPEALEVMARAMEAAPGGRLFYSDEDKVSDTGERFNPHFKNGAWDWELVAAQNFVCHLAAYSTERLRALGGFREGFEGAQDHDLVLRYVTGLEGRELIHVPRVLYHWRAHAGSTAMHLGAKGYALESARAAVRDWLAATTPGAVPDEAPVVQWVRVRHALPASRPLVSLLCRVPGPDFDLAAHARALGRETQWPHELVYLCAAEEREALEGRLAGTEADGVPARLCVSTAPGPEAFNAGARAARGEILGFVSPHVTGASPAWLEETVAALWRPGVGVVGGKTVLGEKRTVAHAGYLADCSGKLGPLFRGAGADESCYFGWNLLPRTVLAMDGLFLFTRAADFAGAGGLDPAMGAWAPQDYCLRLGEEGLRSVWWPFARLFATGLAARAERAAPPAFSARWAGRLAPFNPNLRIDGKGFALCDAQGGFPSTAGSPDGKRRSAVDLW